MNELVSIIYFSGTGGVRRISEVAPFGCQFRGAAAFKCCLSIFCFFWSIVHKEKIFTREVFVSLSYFNLHSDLVNAASNGASNPPFFQLGLCL